ncbi:hypothetical protein [Phenylobacterium deserti]|uniref:Lipoprotein n=1 Tax=Phenylobacterium deserti TaxID=1914756 RepID=A0A328AS77_9CAUL|nr:hypothetical protein [Phenylobacterium deserti]RAK56556.1 hypothetical protein DJ018_00805 [Phenylobacterium deserti]
MKFEFVAALGAAVTLTAACTNPGRGPAASVDLGPAPPSGARLASSDCFYTRDIRSHTVGDDRTMFIEVAGKGVYRIGMSGACLAAAISSDPIVTQQPPGSALVCRPIDLDLSIARNGGGFATRCIVDSLARLTPEQAAALPDKIRP